MGTVSRCSWRQGQVLRLKMANVEAEKAGGVGPLSVVWRAPWSPSWLL